MAQKKDFVVQNPHFIQVVPEAGIEPARDCSQQILSLQRLPVPPQALNLAMFIQINFYKCKSKLDNYTKMCLGI